MDSQSSGNSDAQSGLKAGSASDPPGYVLIEAPVDSTAGVTAPLETAGEPATASNSHKHDLHNNHPPQNNVLVNSPSGDGSFSVTIDEACSEHVDDTQARSGEVTSLSTFEALMNPQGIPTSESQSTVVGGSFDFSDSTVNCDSLI